MVEVLLFLGLAFLALSSTAAPQETLLPEPGSARAEAPGRFHVGPFYVTPSLRIGGIALDTNVFYDSTNPTTDVTGSLGPGLDVVLPVKNALRLKASGHLDYLHYVRTEALRQFTGGAGGEIEWDGSQLGISVGRSYSKRFERPDFEVDRRISQETWQTTATIDLKGLDRGRRFGVTSDLHANRVEIAKGEEYLGADLATNLNRDVYLAALELRYRLTAKTSLVAGGDYQWDRFLLDPGRDADSNRVYGGFVVDSETRLRGRAVGGVRLLRLGENQAFPERTSPYADIAVVYKVSPKTQLEVGYSRDLNFSAFAVSGGTPTREEESYSAGLVKVLVGRLDLQIYGRFTRLVTDGEVTTITSGGESVTAVRDDEVWEGRANLGYTFRSNLRIGLGAELTRRTSTFSDLGIEGLLIGATVEYKPVD